MSRIQDRKNAVVDINAAAKMYKSNLVGKIFLYVFEGNYIEVMYKADNFRHLTGVDTKLTAKQFYQYAAKGILTASQIFFSAKHPYDLSIKKLKHIKDIATLAGTESFMLEEIITDSTIYKFGATDLHFTLCLNKELNTTGAAVSEYYIAQSLRDEDCFAKSKNAYVVTHIFSRRNDEKKYNKILFPLTGLKMEDIPESIREKIDSSLFSKE